MLVPVLQLLLAIAPITTGTDVMLWSGWGGYQREQHSFCPAEPYRCSTSLAFVEVRSRDTSSGLTAGAALAYNTFRDVENHPLVQTAERGHAFPAATQARVNEFMMGAVRLGYSGDSMAFEGGVLLPVPIPTLRIWGRIDERDYVHAAFASAPSFVSKGLASVSYGGIRDAWRYEVGASTLSFAKWRPLLDASAEVKVVRNVSFGVWGESAVPEPKPLWMAGLRATVEFPNAGMHLKPLDLSTSAPAPKHTNLW